MLPPFKRLCKLSVSVMLLLYVNIPIARCKWCYKPFLGPYGAIMPIGGLLIANYIMTRKRAENALCRYYS